MANATNFGALPTNAPVPQMAGSARRWASCKVLRPFNPSSYAIGTGGGVLDPIPGKYTNESSVTENNEGAVAGQNTTNHDADGSLQISLPVSGTSRTWLVWGWATVAMDPYASSELRAVIRDSSGFEQSARLSYRVNDAVHLHKHHFGFYAFSYTDAQHIRLQLRNPSSSVNIYYDWNDTAGLIVMEAV